MNKKKLVRKQFRDAVFGRDRYRCVLCGHQSSPEKAEEELDAHHITDRHHMPNGGYVKENGATLCKNGNPSCHEKVETGIVRGVSRAPELYALVGSSYVLAFEKSKE